MESDNQPGTAYDVYQGESAEGGPQKSIEGWIIIVRNVREEATEEELTSNFEKFGSIRNLHLNLDRRTGYVKGYAFIEYSKLEEARSAVQNANGQTLLGNEIQVDWAFRGAPRRK